MNINNQKFSMDFYEGADNEDESNYLRDYLSKSLSDSDIIIKYQPIKFTASHNVYGMEAFVCWSRSSGHNINMPTDKFLDMVERFDLTLPIDTWILETSINQAAIWSESYKPLVLSLNLSNAQLYDYHFHETVRKFCDKNAYPVELLALEVNEASLVRHANKIDSIIGDYSSNGFGLTVDEFGLDSSFTEILEAHGRVKVKLSSRLISNVLSDDLIRDHVKYVADLASHNKVMLLADGIDSQEQSNFMSDLGCNLGQGLYFGAPLSASEFENLLKQED